MMFGRRILCVWLPYWATTRLRHSRGSAAPDELLATVQPVRGQRRLAAVCPRAEAAGLHPGQTLTQARALCPALVVADATPAEDAEALAALARWATRYTPLAAATEADTLWLDIAGCTHLHGSEAALTEDLARRLEHWGLVVRWAIADTTGAAHALSRHGHCSIVPPGAHAGAIACLPAAALRLDAATMSGLRRLGLKTIGNLARLPRAELATRFGPLLGLLLDYAQGDRLEPVVWPQLQPDWTEQQALAEPILTTESCQAVLRLLAHRLCARLDAKRLGGQQFVAGFQRLDGSVQPVAIATGRPVADAAYLLRLLYDRLDGLDPGFGIERVSLAALGIDAMAPPQAGLGRLPSPRLAQMIDALVNRLRPGGVWRLAPRDSHIPEQATTRIPPLPALVPAWPHDPTFPRPIRLLSHPEPIEVTAAVPDDPPVQFRWRDALHRVRAATGPERIAGEWWSATPGTTRDYYHVEDVEGGRFWMFRAASAWFLHGLFG